MPIDETLSRYSDYAFVTAIAIYALAMFLYLGDQAFGKALTRKASARRELVGAGGTTTSETTDSVPEQPRGFTQRLGRMGVALTVLGLLSHVTSIVLRGLAVDRWPLGNMYEYIAFITAVAVASFLVLAKRFPVYRIGAFVLVPVVVLMFLGGTVLYAQAAPVMPALQSYWIVIHVTIISSSTGILLVPGIASLFYLVRSANEKNPARFARFAAKLPSKEALDRVAYRTTIFAFPLYTVGIICGAIWAEQAWGRFWGWDPKETCAFVAWVIYAIYLHSRSTAGWRGNPSAIINSVGFAMTVFNLFFINLVTTGLHSYAGLG
jgi:cytochrome c-type biogenesis protein CcsB